MKEIFQEFIIVLGLLFSIAQLVSNGTPDFKFIKIWGPGLEPHKIVMPARYFFIGYTDKNNNSLASSIQSEMDIIIEGGTKQQIPCRIWSNILDRKDGSLIVRYKVYEVCSYINIYVKYKNQHIAKSPYTIKEVVYPDDCYCPQESIARLLGLWKCEAVPSQIVKSFELFKNIDWDMMRAKVCMMYHCKKGNDRASQCLYQIGPLPWYDYITL